MNAFVSLGGSFGGLRLGEAAVCPANGRVTQMTLAREVKQDTNPSRNGKRNSNSRRRRAAHRQNEEKRNQRHVERRMETPSNANTHLVEMLDYLRGLGLSIEDCGRVVQRRPQLVNLDIQRDMEPLLKFLHGPALHMTEKQVARTIRNAPQIFFKSRNTFFPRMEFLKILGIEEEALANVASARPHTMWMDLTNAKSVVDWVRDDIGVEDKKEMAKFFAAVPQVLLDTPKRMEITLKWLEDKAGMDRDSSRKACKKWPYLFSYKTDTTLAKRVEYLQQIGLRQETIARVMEATPNVIAMSIPAQLDRQLKCLTDIGVEEESFDHIVSTVPNFFTTYLQLRIDFLLSVGLEKEVICKVVKAQPGVLFLSTEGNLKPKWEYLTNVIGGGPEDLDDFPTYFGLNLEERIMPRYSFCLKNGISAPIKDMIGGTDERFCRTIAKVPYDEYRQFEAKGEWMLFSTPLL